MTASLRAIDLTGFEQVQPGPMASPRLRWVAIADLVIDDTYQRKLERRGRLNVQAIANEFSWSKFTPILVAPLEGGKLAIIDGQHRTHAAALCGFTEVPALVNEMSLAEQASAFSWVNGHVTAVSAFHIFKAALAAGEPWAVDSDAVVAEADCRLMTSNYSQAAKQPGQIFCVGLIKKRIQNRSKMIVRRGLKAIRQSECRDQIEYYGAVVLTAWFAVIEQKKVVSVPLLAAFLNQNSFDDILHRVDRMRETPEYFNKSRGVMFQASLAALLGQYLRDQRGAPQPSHYQKPQCQTGAI